METNEFRKAVEGLMDEFLDLKQEYLEMEEDLEDLSEMGETFEADKLARELKDVGLFVEDAKRKLLSLIENA
jgi:hypothetical protein